MIFTLAAFPKGGWGGVIKCILSFGGVGEGSRGECRIGQKNSYPTMWVDAIVLVFYVEVVLCPSVSVCVCVNVHACMRVGGGLSAIPSECQKP